MDSTESGDGKKLREVKGAILTLAVLKLLEKGFYAKQIATELKISKVTVHNHIEKLIKNGYAREDVRSSFKAYAVTDRGKKAIEENKLRLTSCISTTIRFGTHLRIKIPIIQRGNLPDGFWTTINTRFRNSLIKHRDLEGVIEGVSVRETSKAIEVNIKHRKLNTLKEIIPIVAESKDKVVGYFLAYGYVLDTQNWLVNDSHNTIWTKETEEVAEEAGRFEVVFPWDRAKFTPRDPSQPAKAWFDKTPTPNLETNDMDYAEAFIRMPIAVLQIVKLMEKQSEQMATYAEHLNAHIPVLKDMHKLYKKLDKALSQKNLKDFI